MCQRCDRDLVPQLVRLHKAGVNLRIITPALCTLAVSTWASGGGRMGQMFYDSIAFTLGIVGIAWGIFFLYWCHEFHKGAQVYKSLAHKMDNLEDEIAKKVLEEMARENSSSE